MSFNRTNYDICSVEQSLEQSMKPGQYRLNPPTKSVSECFLVDPNIRLQKTGNSVNKNKTRSYDETFKYYMKEYGNLEYDDDNQEKTVMYNILVFLVIFIFIFIIIYLSYQIYLSL